MLERAAWRRQPKEQDSESSRQVFVQRPCGSPRDGQDEKVDEESRRQAADLSEKLEQSHRDSLPMAVRLEQMDRARERHAAGIQQQEENIVACNER